MLDRTLTRSIHSFNFKSLSTSATSTSIRSFSLLCKPRSSQPPNTQSRISIPSLPLPPTYYLPTRSLASMTSWTPPPPESVPAPAVRAPQDMHTHADVSSIRTLHLHLDWTIDWEKQLIHGSVEHQVEILKDGTDKVVFDTSFLDVKETTVDGEKVRGQMGERNGTLGSGFTIKVGEKKKGDKLMVKIRYSTTKECTALGWLTAE